MCWPGPCGPTATCDRRPPDSEHSGAAASLGPFHLMRPEVRTFHIEGIDEAYSVNGPPGLCVMFARLGVFGALDLVVSGINPGANVGRAVYHSGTVGAAITARNGGLSGVAVSQAVAGFGVEGQGWDEMIHDQHWEAAAHIGSLVVGAVLASPPAEPVVVNVNVPNLPVEQLGRWRHAEIGLVPPRAVVSADLEPIGGREGVFGVRMEWGDAVELPPETDTGAIQRDEIAISYLSRLRAERRDDLDAIDRALDGSLLPAASYDGPS